MPRISGKVVAATLAACSILVFPKVRGWNDASRMATVQAIVEHGTLSIEQTTFADTGDKVYINGTFYSDKPVAPALLAAFVYWPVHAAGLDLGQGVNVAYFLVTLLTVKILWIGGLYCFYMLAQQTGISREGTLWLVLALGVGTIHLTWSSTFNNHTLAASALIIGLYFLVMATTEQAIRRNLFLSGLFLGFAGISDIPTGIFYACFGAIVASSARLRRSIWIFLAPLILTLVPYLAVNWHLHGSVLPVQLVKAYFLYPGSPWIATPEELAGTGLNSPRRAVVYGLGLLVGRKGFLLYNPMLFVAFAGAARAMRRGGPLWRETHAIAAGSSVLFLFYAWTTAYYGGSTYSIRWFVPLLPLLMLLAYPAIDGLLTRRRTAFYGLLAVSVMIAVIGMLNPWSISRISETPLVANLKQAADWMR